MTIPSKATYNPFSPTEPEGRAGRILIELNVPMLNDGFTYLCTAIAETYNDPDVAMYVTKTMTPRVAKRFGTKPDIVHRSIARALVIMRKHPNKDAKKRYLGSENAETDVISIVRGIAQYLHKQDAAKQASRR